VVDDHLADLCRRAGVRERCRDALQALESHGRAFGGHPCRAFVGVEPRIVDGHCRVPCELDREREILALVPSMRLGHRERDGAERPPARDQRNTDRRSKPDSKECRLLLLRQR
jgi:hypothetical protein